MRRFILDFPGKLPIGLALSVSGWLLPNEPMSIFIAGLVLLGLGGFLVGVWAAEYTR